MSRKHNVRKLGGRSQYPARLAARGETNSSVRMPFLDENRRQHDTIEAATRAGSAR